MQKNWRKSDVPFDREILEILLQESPWSFLDQLPWETVHEKNKS